MNNISRQIRKWVSLAAALLVCAGAAAQSAAAETPTAAQNGTPQDAGARNRAVTGRVVDANGTPLSGAEVVAQGTGIGVISGRDGGFTISVPSAVTQLDVKLTGYEPRSVPASSGGVTVTLTESAKNIEELVMIGFGNVRRKDLTGSISSVDVNSVEASSAVSIQSLLSGRATGVQVTTGDGAPGSAVNITIRGASSLQGNSEPLYVVDGIIMNPPSQDVAYTGVSASNNFQQTQNGLTGINPADIQSMEILKDASATAIYGAMGANGVVLITTKSGTAGAPKVTFSSTASVSNFVRMRQMLDLNEYAAFREEVTKKPFDMTGLTPIDWQKDVSRTAISNSQRLSISGKSDQTSYYIAGGLIDNNGIIKGTSVRSWDIRMNLDHTVTKFFKVGTKSAFTGSRNSMVQGSDTRGNSNSGLIRQMNTFRPYLGGAAVDNTDMEQDDSSTGPRAWLDDYSDNSSEYRMIASLYTDLRFTKWLSMRTTVGVDYRNKSRDLWYGMTIFQGQKQNGISSRSSLEATRYNVDNMFNISYDTKNKEHHFDGVAGITMIGTTSKSNPIGTSQFGGNIAGRGDGFPYGISDDKPQYFITPYNSFSALGRLVYSFRDRYIATATFRADGTSKFAPGRKFAYFPSLALAWRFSEEQAVRNLGVISNGKLRLGWGMVGSNSGSQPYQTMQTYNTGQYAQRIYDPVLNVWTDGFAVGLQAQRIPNPKLKWETTVMWNGGLDLGLWRDRVNFTVDLYDKTSRDLLQQISIAGSSGYQKMTLNRGSIQNRGIEVSFDFTPVQTKNTRLTISGNLSRNINKIKDIGLEPGQYGAYNNIPAYLGNSVGTYISYANIFMQGQPMGLFFGLKSNGIVNSGQVATDRQARTDAYMAKNPTADPAAVAANPDLLMSVEYDKAKGMLPLISDGNASSLLQAGDPLWYDASGNGVFDAGDQIVIGNPNPDFTYGFGVDFTWKGFFISAMFNGTYGNQIANANRMVEEQLYDATTNNNITRKAFYGMWRPDYQDGGYPAWGYNTVKNYLNSMLIEDGSFLRCSLVSVGYNWRFRKGLPISGLGVNITGRNLFVVTNYSGYDPEVTSFTNDQTRMGIDWGSYPNSRTFTLGLTLDF